jgi:hypothetical protein
MASRSCIRASAGGRSSRTSCRRSSTSGSSRSRLATPGLGPNRIAAELARARWAVCSSATTASGAASSGTGSTRAASASSWSPATRLRPSRRASPSRSGTSRPSGRAPPEGMDSFYVGRLTGTKGAVWHLTAIDVASSYASAEFVSCPRGNPDRRADLQARLLRRRPAAGGRLGDSSASSPTTAASTARPASAPPRPARRPSHPDPRRTTAEKRGGRITPPNDPRGMPATRLRSLPARPLHRAQTRPRQLPPPLRPRARPHPAA